MGEEEQQQKEMEEENDETFSPQNTEKNISLQQLPDHQEIKTKFASKEHREQQSNKKSINEISNEDSKSNTNFKFPLQQEHQQNIKLENDKQSSKKIKEEFASYSHQQKQEYNDQNTSPKRHHQQQN